MTAGAISVPMIFPLRPPVAGKLKNSIDTNTLIELSCNTNGATVYYTLNGTKPDPFQPLGSGPRYTHKYKNPFVLHAGKQTVKAVAVSADGVRESHVVSKTFDVLGVESEGVPSEKDNDVNFQDDMALGTFNPRKHAKNLVRKLLAENEAWAENSQTSNKMIPVSNRLYPGTKNAAKGRPQSAKATISTARTDDLMTNGPSDIDPYDGKKKAPDHSSQILRLQRESDFTKCSFCFSPRPADPYAKFCNVCGNTVPPVPQTQIFPPPQHGVSGLCLQCKSMVPFNLPTCVVCEAVLPKFKDAKPPSSPFAKKVQCMICGTQNPAEVAACTTCEARLPPCPPGPLYPVVTAPPPPSKFGNKMIYCSKCTRVNDPNARFCDWCGAKPTVPVTSAMCQNCNAGNHPYAKFCGTCATQLEPPRREDPRCEEVKFNFFTSGGTKLEPQWLPLNVPLPREVKKPTRTWATQTVGLFYNSVKEIDKQQAENEDKLTYEKIQKDRRPLLTAVSPGRGYWRKQMDHICAHLRAHAQSDSDFRALVGEPKMGKLVSATIQEDGYEMDLNVKFVLRGNKDPYTGKNLTLSKTDFLGDPTLDHERSPTETFRSDVSSVLSEKPKKTKKKKVVKKAKDDKLSEKDKALLKEIGKNGDGNPTEIENLIDEGADPNCLNKDGLPPLFVAVMNRQLEAIPILVQNKADLNKKGPNKGNTPLHEAVMLGDTAGELVSTLLGCGAKQNLKNEKGETAYDLAVKNKFDGLAERLASERAQSQLDKLVQSRCSTADIEV